MRTPTGLFTSAYDADSEGKEGKYYVWSKHEIERILVHHEADEFCEVYGVTAAGNFEGHNILNRIAHPEQDEPPRAARLALARQELLQERRNRVPPLHDDKSLADWNSLAIAALAEAALVFGSQEWLDAAQDAHAAVLQAFWDGTTLLHSHRAGKTRHRATAHDYAQLIECSLVLAGATGDTRVLDTALTLHAAFERQHWSTDHSGFLLTATATNDLPANDITIQDDVTPSPNAVMVRVYTRFGYIFGDRHWHDRADTMLRRHIKPALDNPFAAPSLLGAAAFARQTWQLSLYGVEAPIRHHLLRKALQHTGLDAVIIHRNDGSLPAGTFTICRGSVCSLPVSDEASLEEAVALVS
jgi:uncharacterized protein YyaL (SSP411 family)